MQSSTIIKKLNRKYFLNIFGKCRYISCPLFKNKYSQVQEQEERQEEEEGINRRYLLTLDFGFGILDLLFNEIFNLVGI